MSVTTPVPFIPSNLTTEAAVLSTASPVRVMYKITPEFLLTQDEQATVYESLEGARRALASIAADERFREYEAVKSAADGTVLDRARHNHASLPIFDAYFVTKDSARMRGAMPLALGLLTLHVCE
jgi:hypothetical protein